MSSSNSQGSTTITLQFDSEPQYRCRRAGHAGGHRQSRRASCRRDAAAAFLSKGQSGRPAGSLSGPDFAPRCRSTPSTNTPRICWRSASPWSAAFRRCRCTARRNTPCACRWIPTRWRRTTSASTKCSGPSQQSNMNLPTGKLYGAKQAFTVQSSGQLTNAAAYRPIIVAYRNGVPGASGSNSGNVIDGVENRQIGGVDQRYARRDSGHPPPARNQHRGSGGQHPERCCRNSARRFRPRSICPSSSMRPSPFDNSIRDVEVHPGADHLPGGDGHLPVPAQSIGHADSRRAPCRSPSSARSP